jgi:hypothetical protein
MPLQSPLVERTGEPDRLQLRKKGWITINNGPALAWAEGVVSRACLGRVSTHGRARHETRAGTDAWVSERRAKITWLCQFGGQPSRQ